MCKRCIIQRRPSIERGVIGAIAGGVVGAIILTTLVVVFLWRLKCKKKPTSKVDNSSMAPTMPSTPLYGVDPYTLPPASTTTQGQQPSKLKNDIEKSVPSEPPVPPPNGVSVTESTPVIAEHPGELGRVHQLRSERDRINRELASLGHNPIIAPDLVEGSAYGGQSTVILHSIQQLLSEQLSVLQSQITQLEERWQHGQSDLPPLYEVGSTRDV